MSGGPRLTARNTAGNGDVAEKRRDGRGGPEGWDGKTENVSGFVHAAELTVERPYFTIAEQRDRHRASSARRRDPTQPRREARRGEPASARVTDLNAQRCSRS